MADMGYQQLRGAVQDGGIALVRISSLLEPGGGAGGKVFPPTFPTDRGDESPYVIEHRYREGAEVSAVVLDQVPSQANRVEEALLLAHRASEISLPEMRIVHEGAATVSLSSLEVPHRYADAFIRDSEIDGVKFDRTPLGAAFRAATLADATALLQHDPGSLVFGAWNSHRKGQQAKFPRLYSSEIVGWNPALGGRRAGRMDPLNLVGARTGEGDDWSYVSAGVKAKSQKLSEIGHGNVAPGKAHGGVTISSASRFATLSLTALRRVRFGSADSEAHLAARTLLAAYALLGDRLAFGGGGLWLRSGCDLVVLSETMQWLGRGGVVDEFTLTTAGARSVFEEASNAADRAGVGFALDPVLLSPTSALSKAIDFSLTKAETTDD